MINTELPLVNDWFRANILSLNISKTSFILFCSHKRYIPEMTPLVQIDNIPIPQTKSVKFLGVIVDQNLTWSEHITQISNKVSKNIGILSRISYKLPAHTLISLYYFLIYPYLAYCNMITPPLSCSVTVPDPSVEKGGGRH